MKGQNGNWDLPFFGLGKWDLLHREWDLTTGKGINTKMGMGFLFFAGLRYYYLIQLFK